MKNHFDILLSVFILYVAFKKIKFNSLFFFNEFF